MSKNVASVMRKIVEVRWGLIMILGNTLKPKTKVRVVRYEMQQKPRMNACVTNMLIRSYLQVSIFNSNMERESG